MRPKSNTGAFGPVWNHMPAEEGEPETVDGSSFSAGDLLPDEHAYYRYDGSLTTPPCSEGVKWFVLTNPVQMSVAQIDAFRNVVRQNNRPVQPLGDRRVMEVAP